MLENFQSFITNKSDPKIYVACLSAYNQGLLFGQWVSMDQSVDGIYDDIHDMLAKSPALGPNEEWAIHDSSGFGQVTLNEYESIEDVAALSNLICEYGEGLASAIWLYTCDAAEAARMLQDNYQGSYDSLEDWAEDFLSSTGELNAIPDHLLMYFDYASYARDAELSGDIFVLDEGHRVHVFWNH